ncbi:MAG: FtsQ-type POTRA domain-containing protein [Clostridia bacterium]|nr:FtsQ-type POTRA domain-containing protein [Clostridia bacterium]
MSKEIFVGKKTKELKSLRKNKEVDYETHRDKYRKRHSKKKFWLRFFIILAVILGCAIFLNSSFFDVDTIKVVGNKYFEKDQIIAIANAQEGDNLFWGRNKGEIKKRLSKNPYIEEVNVSFKLPRTRIITVKERIQKCYIKVGKKYVIMDGKGFVLNESETKPKLTEIMNIKIKKAVEGKILKPEEQVNFEKVLNIITKMEADNVYFSKIKIKQGKVYAYVYDHLIVQSQYKRLLELMDNGKLSKVLYKLQQDGIKRGTVTIGNTDYVSFSPV